MGIILVIIIIALMSRPTELHFRSPKQKTPDYYDVNVNNSFLKVKVT